jgi:hypothetical protein
MEQLGHAGGGLNTARDALAGAGTQTAALAFGGTTPPFTAATEEYDGTSWTTNPTSLNTARDRFRRSRNSSSSFSFWWYDAYLYSSNRRMDRCRFSINSYNHSFLTLYLFI